MEYDDDEDWRESDKSLESGLRPLHASLDRAVLNEALIHLGGQPDQLCKRWFRKLETVLNRFALSQGYHRLPINVGANQVHICWVPDGSAAVTTGLPRSDIDYLMDAGLHAFGEFLELSDEISAHWGLAQLVMVSLVVRRDWSFGDFGSIQKARIVFDDFRSDFVRDAYVSYQQKTVKRTNLRKANKIRATKKNEGQNRIRDELRNMPQGHARKSVLRALRAKGLFEGKTDVAAMKAIDRARRWAQE